MKQKQMSSLLRQNDENVGLREINLNFKEMIWINLHPCSKILFAYHGFSLKNAPILCLSYVCMCVCM